MARADDDDHAIADPQLTETQRIRQRLHHMNDTQQVHALKLNEHEIKLGLLTQQYTVLSTQSATREQLDAAVLSLGEKVSTSVALMTVQLTNLANDLAPIRKGIYWIVTLVLGAVVLAGLSFLLRRPLT